jgi:multiple sugar transport system substrate-binding protein
MRTKLAVAVATTTVLLAACSSGSSSTSTSPSSTSTSSSSSAAGDSTAAGKTVRILVEGGGHSLQQAIADKFTASTGNKVQFIEVPYAGVHDKLSADLAAGTGSYDVATVDVIWLPEFAAKLTPIDDLMTSAVQADLAPALVADGKANGKFIGMPQWANAEILFYRKDLFADATEQANFKAKYGYDLAPPKDWKSYLDVATFFNRPDKGLYGTDTKGAVETEWLAYTLQAGSPGTVLDSSGKVIVDNAQHLAALKQYIDLHCTAKVGPASVANTDWAAAQNLFYQGKSAMMLFWAHGYRLTPTDSTVSGKVGVAPMIAGPGGVAAIPGPWYNVIPSDSPDPALAKQYIQFAYDNNALGIDAPLGLAARTSAYQQFQDKAGYEAFKPLLATLNAPATQGRPLNKNWQKITDQVLVPTVQKALTCTADPAKVLADAKTQIEGILSN